MRNPLVSMVFVIGALLSGAIAAAPGPTMLAPVAPVVSCASLANVDLSTAVGAKVTIRGSAEVKGPHTYCEVTGSIARAKQFEVRLPMSGWTHYRWYDG